MRPRYSYRHESLVMELLPAHSFSEVAATVRLSISTVRRIAARHGFVRSKKDEQSLRSRIRTNLVRQERRRAIFGLDQKTNLKVFSNKMRASLKFRLKRKGYVLLPKNNNVYFNEYTLRNDKYETQGRKLGLRFYHINELESNDLAI